MQYAIDALPRVMRHIILSCVNYPALHTNTLKIIVCTHLNYRVLHVVARAKMSHSRRVYYCTLLKQLACHTFSFGWLCKMLGSSLGMQLFVYETMLKKLFNGTIKTFQTGMLSYVLYYGNLILASEKILRNWNFLALVYMPSLCRDHAHLCLSHSTVYKYKKQLNKIEGWSRDGSTKNYTNKICRDNVSHPLYIPTLAFVNDIIHFWFSITITVLILYSMHLLHML